MLKNRKAYLISLAAGGALLFVPLLRDLHFESAMLAAIIGCYWASFKASRSRLPDHDLLIASRILSYLYTAAVPLLIYALINGCLTFDGFGFWIFTPAPSVFLGVATGRLCRMLRLPAPGLLSFLILSLFSVGILIWQFTSFPQVYFFNHVWGYWPGPIYDESVVLSVNYLLFRFITLLWVLVLWILPVWSDNSTKKWVFILSFVSLLFSYLNYSELGFITPEEKIRDQLGSAIQTEHFNIYYSKEYFDEKEISLQALKHEFYLHKTLAELDMTWPEGRTINSYLYPNAWKKKDLVGAKFTSYVPVWLEQDQLHIAKQQLNAVLHHEIVHVVSKQFGNELFNGSRSTGLIEGLAEAIAKDASQQSTLHQIVAAQEPLPTADEIRSTLSPIGFYSGAGAISYTTMGSFTRFLLDQYPARLLKMSYPKGDLRPVYEKDIDSLVAEWHRVLRDTPVDSTDRSVSELIFAQRSLFEKSCPHNIPQRLRLWDSYRYNLAESDTVLADKIMDDLFHIDTDNPLIKAEWARTKLRKAGSQQVIDQLDDPDSLLTLKVLLTDAYYMNGDRDQARTMLQSMADEIRNSKDLTFRYTLDMRSDSLNWSHHLDRRYRNELPDSSVFLQLSLPNKVLSLQKALELNNERKMIQYSTHLLNEYIPDYFFGTIVGHVDQLIYLKNSELARDWIHKLKKDDLRARYRERLVLLEDWFRFRIGVTGS
ncbi:hypothetical protein AB2B38_010045 [Balneola sp. MJW-20]|uniref:hypothetical protein n=1 Tax=Gracilimonas aurantiaca TaxID=3234185 RepID=UPI0034662174